MATLKIRKIVEPRLNDLKPCELFRFLEDDFDTVRFVLDGTGVDVDSDGNRLKYQNWLTSIGAYRISVVCLNSGKVTHYNNFRSRENDRRVIRLAGTLTAKDI